MLDSHLVTWGVVCLSAGKGHMGRGAQLQVRSVVNKSKLKKKKKLRDADWSGLEAL